VGGDAELVWVVAGVVEGELVCCVGEDPGLYRPGRADRGSGYPKPHGQHIPSWPGKFSRVFARSAIPETSHQRIVASHKEVVILRITLSR
jgi:hypothetical protein